MNVLVKRLLAAELPEALREGIDPSHTVEVTVREVRASQLSAQELYEQTRRYVEKHGNPNGTMEDAVTRVRELRDEWDDRDASLLHRYDDSD
jgi:hypothetical protein